MAEKRILFADKSPAVRKKVSAWLRKEGYEVLTAGDGIEALKKVVSEAPNLLVINNSLTGIKGYQVCKFIKQDPLTRGLPVILLSSRKEKDRLEKMHLGQDGMLEGIPQLDNARLLHSVRKIIGNGEVRRKSKTLKKVPYAKSDLFLLERTLDFVDRKISEEGIYREMRSIALDSPGFEEAFEMILQLLCRHIPSNAGMVYFHQDFRSKIIVRLLRPATAAFVKKLSGIVCDCMSAKKIFFDNSEVDVREVKSPDCEDEEPMTQEDICFYGEHIVIDGHIKGFIGFSLPSPRERAQIEDRIEFFRPLFQQVFITLEQAYLREKLMKLSSTDELTQINNRHRIIDLMKKELLRARRYFLDLSVILFDVDNFKTINDFYGYQVGDVILKDISKLTIETMRSIDEIGRYGGEEFLVILPETNLKNAGIAGNRLKNKVMEHVFPGIAKDIKISVSIGVTGYLRDVDIGVDDMLRRTDQSLYEAKKRGKNCVYIMSK